MNGIKLIFIISFILTLWSCRKASEEIPSYLKCDSSKVKSSVLVGDANSGIYGLYITVGNDVRGTWQMPFRMPILREGTETMLAAPIVRLNNFSNRFINYTLYKVNTFPIQLVRGSTLDTVFTFEYKDDVVMNYNGDMESATNFSNTTQSSIARNGNKSMLLQADFTSIDSSTTAYCNKQTSFTLGKTTYLEFDYYMPEGILAPTLAYNDANGREQIKFGENYLNKNTGWVHVYYNLTPMVESIGSSGLYTLVFIITPPKRATSATAYIDNVRILEN